MVNVELSGLKYLTRPDLARPHINSSLEVEKIKVREPRPGLFAV